MTDNTMREGKLTEKEADRVAAIAQGKGE